MRKFAAIFVLFCLLFLLAGYRLVYHLRIAETKREMRQELLRTKKESLATFVFSDAEMLALDWVENNEFRYRGEMFDILQMETKGDRTVIWCIADKKETALLQQYQRSQKQSTGTSSFLLLKLLSSHYLPCALSALQMPELPTRRIPVFIQHHFPEGANKILTPPPRIC